MFTDLCQDFLDGGRRSQPPERSFGPSRKSPMAVYVPNASTDFERSPLTHPSVSKCEPDAFLNDLAPPLERDYTKNARHAAEICFDAIDDITAIPSNEPLAIEVVGPR